MPRPKIADVLVALTEFRQAMENGLGGVDQRLDSIDQRLDRHDQRFDGIDQRLDRHDQRFDSIDQRFDRHDTHFTGLDQGYLKLDRRIEELDDRLTGRMDALQREMHGGFDALGHRMLRLEDEYQALREGLRRLEGERLG